MCGHVARRDLMLPCGLCTLAEGYCFTLLVE